MSIEKQVDVLIKGRALMLKVIAGCSLDQINTIPKGFNNNIGWNVAHLVVTQQLLCYKLSGLEISVSNEMLERYKKGAKPDRHIIDEAEWGSIRNLFVELPTNLESDYNDGLFKEYSDYKTSVNVTLDSIEKAIDFNNFHEGIHLGILLSLKKLV